MLTTIGAAKAASEYKSLPEVIETADRIRQLVASLAIRGSLFHFHRSSRVGKSEDWPKSEISTVMVLETSAASNGVNKPILRELTLIKSIDATPDLVAERNPRKQCHIAITHTNIFNKAEELRKKLTSRFTPIELYLNEYLLGVAVINGDGLVEFGFYSED